MPPAARLEGLGVSPIRLLSEGAPAGSIPLGLGEPGWDLPEAARRALALGPGPLSYGPNNGIAPLREAIARAGDATPDEVLVTAGSQGALAALFLAFAGPDDAVLVPDPGFVAYPALARLAGARAVRYALAREDRFRLDAGAFVAALEGDPAIRIAVLNHPSNPTGGGASPAALRTVAEACAARDVLLVSDEVYRELHLGERPAGLRDVSRHGVVVGSASKAFGGPGLRIGWIVGDPRWTSPARIVQSYLYTGPSVPAQRAALALFADAAAVLAGARAALRERWESFAAAWAEHVGSPPAVPPDGAFYHWTPLPPRASGGSDLDLVLKIRDESRVVVIPGEVFGPEGRGFARVSFAAKPEVVAEGVRRLAPWYRGR